MHEIGLYHPRIHFPSDVWIKTAALYWTKMARIVPAGYEPEDSDTVRALRDALNFVVDLDPQEARGVVVPDSACLEFEQFLRYRREELQSRYGFPQSHLQAKSLPARRLSLGHEVETVAEVSEVAYGKVSEVIGHLLELHRLAAPVDEQLLMHRSLAAVYMSALAEDIARVNHLRPITDDSEVYNVGTGWTADRMNCLLLHAHDRVYPKDLLNIQEAIGMIAIQVAVPRNIAEIPVRKIIWIRERFGDQFLAFRKTIESIAQAMDQELQTVQDINVLHAYLEQEVHERLLVPTRQLTNEMRRMKVDTVTATLTFKYEVPALAGLVAGGVLSHEPLLAGGAAVSVGLLGLARGMRRDAGAKRDSSPFGYLMLLEDKLGAQSTLERAVRRIRKITGLS